MRWYQSGKRLPRPAEVQAAVDEYHKGEWEKSLGKGSKFRESAHGPDFNSMQRDCLFLPTLVHSAALNGAEHAAAFRGARRGAQAVRQLIHRAPGSA